MISLSQKVDQCRDMLEGQHERFTEFTLTRLGEDADIDEKHNSSAPSTVSSANENGIQDDSRRGRRTGMPLGILGDSFRGTCRPDLAIVFEFCKFINVTKLREQLTKCRSNPICELGKYILR